MAEEYEPIMSRLTEHIIYGVVHEPPNKGGDKNITLNLSVTDGTREPGKGEPGLYWRAIAYIGVQQWRADGYDLNDVIARTIGQVPQSLLYPELSKPGKPVLGKPASQSKKFKVKRSSPPPETSPPKKRVVRRKG